jgi:hypothetical protein
LAIFGQFVRGTLRDTWTNLACDTRTETIDASRVQQKSRMTASQKRISRYRSETGAYPSETIKITGNRPATRLSRIFGCKVARLINSTPPRRDSISDIVGNKPPAMFQQQAIS